jgi:proteasome lid subunit RPN8/RPN11
MLRLPRDLYDAIVAHARADHPQEACGMLAGTSGEPARHVPMANAAGSCRFYEFDPQELLRAYAGMDERGEDPVVVYHSHTATLATPSALDILHASEAEAHYVIVATEPFEVRSWRIRGGAAQEEPLIVIDERARFDPICY